MDVLKRVNRELNQEMRKQVDLIYSAAAIAFTRYWDKGWGPERIRRIFDKTLETWNECGATNQISMIQMLENESGIELRIPNMDKGWRELAYLNAQIDMGQMSVAQMIYMRQRQKKWIDAMLMACLFLSLHRKYGFGKDRLVRLMEQIHEIEAEFNFDRKKLVAACRTEAGVNLQHKFGGEHGEVNSSKMQRN